MAAEGIATPGHLNFFLVAHQGLKGTSVPCHYHVLHLDERLRLGVDDIERLTYDLCHVYSRADKTVSYAPPAYFADHLCENGKLYLEESKSMHRASRQKHNLEDLDLCFSTAEANSSTDIPDLAPTVEKLIDASLAALREQLIRERGIEGGCSLPIARLLTTCSAALG